MSSARTTTINSSQWLRKHHLFDILQPVWTFLDPFLYCREGAVLKKAPRATKSPGLPGADRPWVAANHGLGIRKKNERSSAAFHG